MITCTVHEPPDEASDRLARAERVVFVRDGFSVAAAFLTPFWLLANRLWLALFAYLALAGLLEVLAWAFALDQQLAAWIMIGLHVIIGFEGGAIRRWSLARRGYTMVGSVAGRTQEDCERRFFEAWLQDQPFISREALASSGGSAPRRNREGRLGALALLGRGS